MLVGLQNAQPAENDCPTTMHKFLPGYMMSLRSSQDMSICKIVTFKDSKVPPQTWNAPHKLRRLSVKYSLICSELVIWLHLNQATCCVSWPTQHMTR